MTSDSQMPARPASGAGRRRWVCPTVQRVPIDETAAGTHGADSEVNNVGGCTETNLSIAVNTNCFFS